VRAIPVYREDGSGDALIAAVVAAVQPLQTLSDVLSWARASSPDRTPRAIVTQDEYTHDVVLRFDERTYLAFDTT
jgi:hypothetical protein